MADAVVLELLRGRSLLVDVVALTLAEGLIHLRAGDVDGLDGRVIQPSPMTGILEHGERLATVIDEYPLAPELVPGEGAIGRASREKEAVLLVDLGEVDGRRRLALLQWTKTL
jgi:hypothetical protein